MRRSSSLDLQMAAAMPSCVHFGAESEAREGDRTIGARLQIASRVPATYTFSSVGRRVGSYCNGCTVVDGVTIAVTDGYVSLQSHRQAGAAMKVRILSALATLSLTAARLMLAEAHVEKLT